MTMADCNLYKSAGSTEHGKTSIRHERSFYSVETRHEGMYSSFRTTDTFDMANAGGYQKVIHSTYYTLQGTLPPGTAED